MEYSLLFVLYLISAFMLGMFAMDKIIFYKIRKALKEAGVDVDSEESTSVNVRKFFVETINDNLYLYEIDTNNFIGQGKSLTELALLSKDKADIAGVKYNEEVIWFVNGEVKTSV